MAEEQIEIRDLLILLLKRSWFIAICVGVAGFVGKRQADRPPDLFQSTALLMPTEPARSSGNSSKEGTSSSEGSDIAFYSALMRSRLVMREVLLTQVLVSPDSPRRQTVASIMKVDTTNDLDMQVAAWELSNSMELSDMGNGILQLSFTSTNQYLAPQMVDLVSTATQRSMQQVRVEKFNTVLAKLETSLQQTKDDLRRASTQQAQFQDQNDGLEVGRLRVTSQEIETERKMKEATYLATRQKVDQMRLERDQLYPPVVVLDPASRPAVRIGPNRRNTVMLALFIGLVVGGALVLAWEFLLRKRSP
jgi:uncharacterized protein involved in exopolysaccharide biosynthesis